jgi:mono/diheme cytochrome c family protein
MPSYAEVIPPDERWDLVNYVLSLARVPPWEAGGKLEGPGQHRDLIRRGEYLVHAQMCGLCHTQINRTGIYRGDDFYLAGGMRVDAYPHGFYISRNLTSDPETGLGRWAKEEIANAIRNGRSRDRVLNPVDMPWHYLHALEEEDAMAIASYLKTLKPVYNKISHALHYGVVETIVMKLLEPTKVLRFIDGNFGQRPQGPLLGLPQEILVGAQLLVFILGIFAFLFAGPPNRRYPQTISGWIFLFFMVIGIFLLCMVGLAVFRFPGFILIPPDRVANTVLTKIPTPNETHLKSPEQAALVKRGRYLYTVASCALCHGPEGGGGLKISWQAFGTLWTRNITPHPENGIGAWNELEIARAIRSGVTPDGRMLHWQGMIWDHASNWDEEDIRALGAYLRTLPPVDNEVPPARPPAPDDCKKYTFWITPSDLYGCQ